MDKIIKTNELKGKLHTLYLRVFLLEIPQLAVKKL